MLSDSLKLAKLAGLLRSGVSMEKSLVSIGPPPNDSVGLRFLLAVAKDSGSKVANEIDAVADLIRARENFSQRIQVAHANPKATARLVILLPLITLVVAQLVGWNILGTLYDRPIVLASFALGLGLLWLAKLITSRMLDGAKPQQTATGFYLLGVALEASGGANLFQAQDRALKIYRDFFDVDPQVVELFELSEIDKLVQETGARVGALLVRQAQSMQEAELVETEIKIEKLGVRLMLPLGLGVLPAFIFLAIVPLMVTMLGSK